MARDDDVGLAGDRPADPRDDRRSGGAAEPATVTARLRHHLVDAPARHISPHLFGVLPEGSIRRRPSDVTRLAVAVTALVVLVTLGHPTLVDGGPLEGTSGLLDGAPEALGVAIRATASIVLALGPAVAALALRRRRLAAALALAGVCGWLTAVGLSDLLDLGAERRAAGTLVDGSVTRFPTIGLAVLVAVAGTAAPYLTRPSRRLVVGVLGAVAVLAVLQGAALPVDALGALLLGLAVASATLLVIGSPEGTPEPHQVAQAAAQLGVPLTDVRLLARPSGAPRYRGTGPDGDELEVVAYGRDDVDARAAARLWRALAYKGRQRSGPVSRALAVEHEAYVMLLAERAGVAVPEVLAAGVAGASDDALLVTAAPEGRPLADLAPDQLSDDLLDRAWAVVDRLGAARLAHGALDTTTLLLGTDGGLTMVDLRAGISQASPEERQVDAVGLLATTAAVVGPERAVAAARRTLGDDALVALLPRCQPAALRAQAERVVAASGTSAKATMKAIRDEATTATGADAPELVELYRVSWSDLGMGVLTLFGLYLLIQQFAGAGDVWSEMADADWAWVAVAFVLAQLTNVTGAFVLTGAIPTPLPLGSTVAVQFGQAFSGLVGGTAGNFALVVRFCQKQGVTATSAVGAGMINSFSSMVVEAVIVVLALLVGNATFQLSDIGTGGSGGGGSRAFVLAVVVAVVVVGGVLLVLPKVRRQLWAKLKPQVDQLREVLVGSITQPRRALQVFGGQVGSQVLFALTLGASCLAYGTELNLATLILVNTFASLLAGIAPVPGGMGVMEASLTAGLTAAGMDPSAAAAAAITHRLMTTYLPPIWGYLAIVWLRRREEL